MVFAHAEAVDADLLGEYGFGDDVPESLRLGLELAVRPDGDVAEGVQAEFE